MDLRDLKTFLHLAESRHFGRSARAMHVSPSTLSRQIQRLEEILVSRYLCAITAR
ncbi:LysR family transcriptional regulator [Escherichia coli]